MIEIYLLWEIIDANQLKMAIRRKLHYKNDIYSI